MLEVFARLLGSLNARPPASIWKNPIVRPGPLAKPLAENRSPPMKLTALRSSTVFVVMTPTTPTAWFKLMATSAKTPLVALLPDPRS